jgi:hypothetical protein
VALHARDSVAQLTDFNAQADTLSALQAEFRISFFQKGLHSAGTLFQIDHPPLVGLIECNIDINAAFSDVRINIFDLLAKFVFIDHGCSPFYFRGPYLFAFLGCPTALDIFESFGIPSPKTFLGFGVRFFELVLTIFGAKIVCPFLIIADSLTFVRIDAFAANWIYRLLTFIHDKPPLIDSLNS